MRYKYSHSSLAVRSQLDPRLKQIFDWVLTITDHTLSSGHRNKKEQMNLFDRGLSKLKFPRSKHNSFPSKAVDAYPYPQKWDAWEEFPQRAELHKFAGVVLTVASLLGYEKIIRWGGDWDMDGDFTDQDFNDLGHFEIIEPKEN